MIRRTGSEWGDCPAGPGKDAVAEGFRPVRGPAEVRTTSATAVEFVPVDPTESVDSVGVTLGFFPGFMTGRSIRGPAAGSVHGAQRRPIQGELPNDPPDTRKEPDR